MGPWFGIIAGVTRPLQKKKIKKVLQLQHSVFGGTRERWKKCTTSDGAYFERSTFYHSSEFNMFFLEKNWYFILVHLISCNYIAVCCVCFYLKRSPLNDRAIIEINEPNINKDILKRTCILNSPPLFSRQNQRRDCLFIVLNSSRD